MKTVVDCFTFYNELEILELRFLELYDVVDKFIIVEANKTFKGDFKPFILEENKLRFEKWWDKVAHIHIDPEKNEFLPKNWRILLPLEEKYKIKDGSKETDI